jgi:hypothetical protein
MSDDNIYYRYYRRFIAYHEAGHAVASHRLGLRFDYVEVCLPPLHAFSLIGPMRLGQVKHGNRPLFDNPGTKVTLAKAVQEVASKILVDMTHTYAGPIAEACAEFDLENTPFVKVLDQIDKCIKEGEGVEGSDYEYLEKLHTGMVDLKQTYVKEENWPDFDKMFDPSRTFMNTLSMIAKNWQAVTRLAEVLIERDRVDYNEVCEIIGPDEVIDA